MTRRFLATLSLAALCILLAVPSWAGKRAPRARTWVHDFRADTLGLAPSGTIVMGGVWTVVEDSSAGAPSESADSVSRRPHLLRQASGDEGRASNWIRLVRPVLETGEVSVRFRINSGEIDPSVGIVFQVDKKGRNGYLIRISGADNELVAHYLLSGKRRDIKMEALAAPAAGEWHTLGVRRERTKIVVTYDGVEKMDLRDERFIRGTVGLWTEDDTVADFAELKITAR